MEKGKEKIIEHYISYINEHQRRPVSVAAFCKHLGMEEKEFYSYYSSFDLLDQDIWEGFAASTLSKIKKEEVYQSYMVREKLLSFYFTLIEHLKEKRSYVTFCYQNPVYQFTSHFLNKFKEHFKAYTSELVVEGTDSGEIEGRFFVADRYPDLLWLQAMSIIRYWAHDQSRSFEKTDVFVEKSVNLSFDLMGSNFVDSGLDLVKFLFQKKEQG